MHPELSSVAQELRHFFAESLETGPPSDDERFGSLALRLFRLQHDLNPPLHRLCNARGITLESITDWREIPAVSTSAFKEFPFSCLPEPERSTYFESSGTTHSARSRSFHSEESLELYHASLSPWFQRHLLPETTGAVEAHCSWDFIALTPSKLQAPHSSLVHMLDAVSVQSWFQQSTFAGDRDADGAWTLDVDGFLRAIDTALTGNRAVVLAGTAFNFVHLLDCLSGRSLRLPAGSRIMETGGYKGRSRELPRDELHAELADRLDLPQDHVVTEYGMTELGSQAYDQVAGKSSKRRGLKFPPWVRARVVCVETGRAVTEGESGLVQIIDLANAFSVMAVETEDLAISHPEGLELMGRRVAAEPRGCSLMAV